MTPQAAGELLRHMFEAAVAAADAGRCVPPHLPAPPRGRTVVVGAGKATAAMALAVEAHWPAAAPLGGVIAVPETAPGLRRIRAMVAEHPVPGEGSFAAGQAALAAVRGLTPDDLVLGLFSGGGSALMEVPAPGVSRAALREVTAALLRSGAAIGEMNGVRRHLSALKGGWLAAAAAPAEIVSLLISDVPGDDPGTIASGPTVPDPTTAAEARAVLAAHGIAAPAALAETPKPGDAAFARVRNLVVAAPQASLLAAAEIARAAGVTPLVLGDAVEGEAREVARAMAGMARACARHGTPAAPPCVLISGGETTVTVRGAGRGGRNAEFALALAVALRGEPGVYAIACDTDGIDGVGGHAGALVGPGTLAHGDAVGALLENDAYGFFEGAGGVITTGWTGVNVNDFRAILVLF